VSTLDYPLAVPDPAGPPSPQYPAQLEIAYPQELNRWMPLIKWLLVIPHYFVLAFLGIGAFFVAIFAWFAVLFTGRYPRGAFDYLVGVQRWSHRVSTYYLFMTDPYPPFSLDDDPNYPVRLNIDYPEHIANWRPLVQWLLVIPYAICAGILFYFTMLLAFIAFFCVLFTKNIPRGIFELMVPGMRWQLRANTYAYFMTERYPPFQWG
jgi:hypothetical protein